MAKKEIFEIDQGSEPDLPQVSEDPSEDVPEEAPFSPPPGTVLITVDQMTFYLVAALVVVFAAYLIGYYASRTRREPAPREPSMEVVPSMARLLPSASGRSEAPPPPLPGEIPSPSPSPGPGRRDIPPASDQKDARYTLEVIRFKTEDRMVAVITVQKLQKLGYVPAFLSPRDDEIAVCVGRFADRNDKLGLQWRDEIRNMHRAYRYCEFVPLK